jgi:hypothetical protein
VAATLKVADWPVVTVWLAGCAVIEGATGAGFTESVAVLLVALPALLLTTTVNSAPLSELSVVAVM